jgi:RNA polymerase sigma factor (sigma-70 family)
MSRRDAMSHLRLDALPDQELLARVLNGRDNRQVVVQREAERAWEALASRFYPRVRGWVEAFRFPGHADVRIAIDDYDDATQECFIRAGKMVKNLRGTTIGEFVGALRGCVTNTCMDFCRRTLARERRLAGSIDETLVGAEDESVGKFDARLGAIAARKEEQNEASRDELAALAAAIDELSNPQMREVLRKRMVGTPSQEIADGLEISIANENQLFSRGVRKLREVMSDE